MNLQSGTLIESFVFPKITPEMLKAYAQAAGDPNPIHLDEAAARAAGLPGLIAHGMLIAGFMGERARSYASEQMLLHSQPVLRFQVRFKAMTLVGDEVSVGGAIKAVLPDRVQLQVEAKNQRGETVATGMVDIRLAR